MSLHCGTVCGRGVREGTMVFAQLSAGCQSLLCYPQANWVPSGADSCGGGFVYVLGPCGSLE